MDSDRSRPWTFVALFCLLGSPVLLPAQGANFLGAVGGITTLSADSRAITSPETSRFSQYAPSNGATYWLFGGRHFNDYLSAQVSYGWNRNQIELTASEYVNGQYAYYVQDRQASQQSVIAEAMLYFRDRGSIVRPYLSAGFGAVHVTSDEERIESTEGDLPAPDEFSATEHGFRVAVGIDLALHDGWAFRYIFSETMMPNPISEELTPPGEHSMKKFQNLFGIVKSF